MSVLFAVVSHDPADLVGFDARRACADVRGQPAAAVHAWRGAHALIAVGEAAWEREVNGGVAGAAFAEADGVIVAADATLYYLPTLRDALRQAGIQPRGDGAAYLIAAGYRAWGDRVVDHLEGDFAFVLWDTRSSRLLASRDFLGLRPLHFAARGETLVVATTCSAVLAHPAVSDELNYTVIGAELSGLFSHGGETCYRDILRVETGHALTWSAGGAAARLARVWSPPAFAGEEEPVVPFDEAAAQLRTLLLDAVRERMAPSGVTSLTLSGGYDSSSVYGIARTLLREEGARGRDLRVLAYSFPEGDTGHEDHIVRASTSFWGDEPVWLPIGDIPIFSDAQESASRRDEAFAHAFGLFNVRLAQASAEAGARVMLDGHGGDLLFHAELFYLADLLRGGRLLQLAREWRSLKLPPRYLAKWTITPALGSRTRAIAERIAGRAIDHPLRKVELPPWVDPGFARDARLVEREEAGFPPLGSSTQANYEKAWLFSNPFFGRIAEQCFRLALPHGVQRRSPLMDARLLRFAAGRPRAERRAALENKRLLRAALRGLLPEQVLAPRPKRTGTLGTYREAGFNAEFAAMANDIFTDPLLGRAGIVRADLLLKASRAAVRGNQWVNRRALIATLHAELWLRARQVRRGAGQHSSVVAEQQDAVLTH